ncbi:MAG: type II toxin-antitoxin system HicA family toxin [Bacteroidota bacterium]
MIRKNGWILTRTSGKHFIYTKNGESYPVPHHGSKEVPTGTEKENQKGNGTALITANNYYYDETKSDSCNYRKVTRYFFRLFN